LTGTAGGLYYFSLPTYSLSAPEIWPPAGTLSVYTGVDDVVQPQEPLVLIVEDDPQSRDGYAEFLERGGFRVAQAGSAEDALTQSLALIPDVIVTDIALPGRDGFSLATEIKCEPRTQGIPVVAMTAYWATDVHERADKAGITAILAKPCQPEHLIAELNRVLQRLRATPAPAAIPKRRKRTPEANAHR
jgi:CheY-like chemotaxis protein